MRKTILLIVLLCCYFTIKVDNRVIPKIESKDYVEVKKEILNNCEFIHVGNFINLNKEIFKLMLSECDRWHIPYSIYFTNIDKESGFRFVKNTEGSGAMGFNQVMPKTFNTYAKKLKLKGGHTPENDVKVGACYLHDMHKYWKKKTKTDKDAWVWTIGQYQGALVVNRDSTNKIINCYIDSSSIKNVKSVLKNYDRTNKFKKGQGNKNLI